MRALFLTAFWLSLAAVSAQAADLPISPKPSTTVVRPAGIPASCVEWTDNCRVCALSGKGAAACSNIGIACLPEKWRCSRP